MTSKQFLKAFGATEKGAAAFLTLLELGAQPVGVMAKQLELPRSSTYLLMSQLKALGLVEEFEQHGIRYVQCMPVSSFEVLLKTREKQIRQLYGMFLDSRSNLEGLQNQLSVTPQVKYYDRKSDVERMVEVVLKAGDMDAIFNPAAVKHIMPDYYKSVPAKMKSEGVKFRGLLMNCLEAKIYKKLYNSPDHQIKILPAEMKFSAGFIVAKNVIYMIAYDALQFSGIEIHNSFLAETHRQVFNELWTKS